MSDESRLSLRRLTFPEHITECLKIYDKHILTKIGVPNARSMRELQLMLDEYLFCISDRRGNFNKRLSEIEYLKMIFIVCQHLKTVFTVANYDAKIRQLYFETLFLGRESSSERDLHQGRIDILVDLSSVALQLKCVDLFCEINCWMQRIGGYSAKPVAISLCSRLLEHFCCEKSTIYSQAFTIANGDVSRDVTDGADANVASSFKNIECPYLACCLLALALQNRDYFGRLNFELVIVLTEWILSNPKFVFVCDKVALSPSKSSQRQPQPTPLFTMCVVGVSKLLCLSIMQPVISFECMTGTLPSTAGVKKAKLSPNDRDEQLYMRLHAGLLQLMLMVPNVKLNEPFLVLHAKHVIDCLLRLRDAKQRFLQLSGAELQVEQCLDRLAQAFQVALVSKCYHGTKREVENVYKELPFKHALFEYIFSSPL